MYFYILRMIDRYQHRYLLCTTHWQVPAVWLMCSCVSENSENINAIKIQVLVLHKWFLSTTFIYNGNHLDMANGNISFILLFTNHKEFHLITDSPHNQFKENQPWHKSWRGRRKHSYDCFLKNIAWELLGYILSWLFASMLCVGMNVFEVKFWRKKWSVHAVS